MKIIFAREVIEDIVAIGGYIAASNPRRALQIVTELDEKSRDLANKPFAFELVQHRSEKEIRRRRSGRYLIFYKIGDGRIDILHILHGAQGLRTNTIPRNGIDLSIASLNQPPINSHHPVSPG